MAHGVDEDKQKDDQITSGSASKSTMHELWLAFLTICCIFLLLPFIALCIFWLTPGYLRAREQGRFTQCQYNLKTIAKACDMYAQDNNGYYPDSLSKIVPNYIPHIPICSNARTDTYSGTYLVYNKVYKLKFTLDGETYYDYNINTSNYTFYCKGANHIKMNVNQPDFPKFSQKEGLIIR